MTILIYLRKSRQDNEYDSVEDVLFRHEKQLQEYAIKNFGYKIEEKNIYREIVSGETIDDRPQINLMFDRMQKEDIEGVLVVETSRLTRGDLLDCGRVLHLFKYTNTLIYTLQKTYDLENKFDRKFFEMELTKGNDYLEYTKEVLTRGRVASARDGNYVASIAPFGYDKAIIDKSPTLIINEEEANIVRLAFDLYLSNHMGYASIAYHFNELGYKTKSGSAFRPKAINDILHNPVYIGKIRFRYRPIKKVYENGKLVTKRLYVKDCELIDGKHEPIISSEVFYAVQEKIEKSVLTIRNNAKLSNMFAGLMKCKYCGSAIGRKRSSTSATDDRYFCRKHVCGCKNGSFRADYVNQAIIETLKATIEDFEIKISGTTPTLLYDYEKVLADLEKESKKIEEKQAKLYEFLENGIYSSDVFIERNKKLDIDRQRVLNAIKVTKENTPKTEVYQEKIVSMKKAIELINDDTVSATTKNIFLKGFIKKILYEKVTDSNTENKETKETVSPKVKIEIFLK